MSQKYDVIVAGAGLAGLLTCLRLKAIKPEQTLCLIETNQKPGGRLVNSDDKNLSWPSGLVSISKELLDFFSHTLKGMPFSYELSHFEAIERARLGVISGGELSSFFTKDALDGTFAHLVGGAPGRRHWQAVLDLLNQPFEVDTSFLKAWKHEKKHPALPALEALLRSVGIFDLWSSSVVAIKERLFELLAGHFYAPWEALFEELMGFMNQLSGFDSYFDASIVDAELSDGLWQLKTKKGLVWGAKLIVAQPPWFALNWLPRHYIPVEILNFALKTKPVSLLTLSEGIEGICSLPDLTFVTSEQVEVFHQQGRNLCYQIPMDYEVSMDAPEVIKALRRLRRAQRKVHKHIEPGVLRGEKLRLQSVAWPASCLFQDNRLIKALGSIKASSDPGSHISFVGDSYGASFCGDSNLLMSLLQMASDASFSSLPLISSKISFAEARQDPQDVPS